MAEAVMIELTKAGVNRQEAHAIMRKCSAAAIQKKIPLLQAMLDDPKVTRLLPKEKLEKLLDPDKYLGSAAAIVDRVVRELSPLAR
jgi:adenylosuccinate lyase